MMLEDNQTKACEEQQVNMKNYHKFHADVLDQTSQMPPFAPTAAINAEMTLAALGQQDTSKWIHLLDPTEVTRTEAEAFSQCHAQGTDLPWTDLLQTSMLFEEHEDDGTIHIAPRCIETKLELLGMTVFAESPLCGTVTHDMVAKTCLGFH